jgi:hypothetical protein
MRFRIADIERVVLEALEIDFLSPEALHRAADLAMDYLDKQQSIEPPKAPALSAALTAINTRESDVREQFKAGNLPALNSLRRKPTACLPCVATGIRSHEATCVSTQA